MIVDGAGRVLAIVLTDLDGGPRRRALGELVQLDAQTRHEHFALGGRLPHANQLLLELLDVRQPPLELHTKALELCITCISSNSTHSLTV